jgi:hypothetical protein
VAGRWLIRLDVLCRLGDRARPLDARPAGQQPRAALLEAESRQHRQGGR